MAASELPGGGDVPQGLGTPYHQGCRPRTGAGDSARADGGRAGKGPGNTETEG